MKLVRTLPLVLLACSLLGQDRPQFVWQGEVDGVAILRLRANRVEVQIQEGAAVGGQKFRYYDRLPQVRQDARVVVQQGRGLVHVVDQPRLENGYSLAVAIEDRQPGSSFYSIAVYWDASGNVFEGGAGRSDRMTWSGRVDQDAVISCRERSCVAESRDGAPVADSHFRFSRPLPKQAVTVRLEEPEGRGAVRLVEQPSERNHYTAQVSIRDPESGAGEYSFVLVWRRPNGKEVDLHASEQGLIWSGVVEGRVRVTVEGGAAFSEAVEGGRVAGERTDFQRPLPARSDLDWKIKKLRGRGDVQLVETPSEKNNYRLVFEVQNTGGGPDAYQVEVDW